MNETLGHVYGQRVRVSFHDYDLWEDRRAHLQQKQVGVPLEHRSCWLRDLVGDDVLFVECRDEHDDALSAVFPVRIGSTRSLPGHVRLRATRLGYAPREVGLLAALQVLPEFVRRRRRMLSLNVELFTTDPARRKALENGARHAGFERVHSQRRYRHTAAVDLSPDEKDIMMGFTGSCRRFIRDPGKKGYRVGPVTEERRAPRMEVLWEETFERTGAVPPQRTWSDHLRFARKHPDLYRIVGTFTDDYPAEESLVSFACGRHNGDHAVYADGASTRDVESGVALTYAPMWEVMKWAKEHGAEWFDMGGITEGTGDDEDPRGGISDFKRRFTEDVIEVGTEWTFRPSGPRTTVADAVSTSASAVRRLSRRLGT